MSAASQVKNIYQRMADVQLKVQTIQKNETVKMYENDKGYKAVTHDDVAAALHKPLAECGVFMLPDVMEYSTQQFDKENQYKKIVTWYRTDIKIKCKWVNIDKPDDFIESSGGAFALDTSDKSYAKAYSLALKIILLKVHLLESRDGEETRPFDEANGGEKFGKDQNQNRNQNQNQNKNQSTKPKDNAQTGATNQEKKPQTSTNTPPPKMSEDQSENIANLMVKHSLDGHALESFFMTGFAVKPDAVNSAQADYLIKLLSVDLYSSAELAAHAEELKVKREARTADPADYVMPDRILSADSLFKGKKLRQIDEKSLRLFIEATDADLKADPKPPEYKLIFEANFKVKTFLKSMGV
jgi:hypothetical protein